MVYHMFRLKTIIKMTFNHFDYPCSGIEIKVTTCFKYGTIKRLKYKFFHRKAYWANIF